MKIILKSKQLSQISYSSRTPVQTPLFSNWNGHGSFPTRLLDRQFSISLQLDGLFLLLSRWPCLWTPGVDQPSPATETLSHFHYWWGRLLPSWSFTPEAHRTSRSSACRRHRCVVFPPRPPSRWISLAGWRHSLFPLSRRRLRSGGFSGLCIDDGVKKWGRLHSNAPSHPRPTCCSEPLSRCARFDRGRGEKAEQQSHQVNEYWSQGRSF